MSCLFAVRCVVVRCVFSYAQVISGFFELSCCFISPKRTTSCLGTRCNPTITDGDVTRPRFFFSSCSRLKFGRCSSDSSLSRRPRTSCATTDIIGNRAKETYRESRSAGSEREGTTDGCFFNSNVTACLPPSTPTDICRRVCERVLPIYCQFGERNLNIVAQH